MGSKLSPLPVIRGHVDTLRHAQTGKYRWLDFATFYGAPAVAAGIAVYLGFRAKDVGAFLGGVSVFAALLFGLVVFVFQLRMTAATDPRIHAGGRLLKLLDQLFRNVSYAVLVGLITTSLGVLSIWSATSDGAPVWLSATLVYSVTHMMLTVLMCLKRVDAAYRRLTHP